MAEICLLPAARCRLRACTILHCLLAGILAAGEPLSVTAPSLPKPESDAPKDEPKKDEPLPEVSWGAVNLSFDEKKSAVVMNGSAYVTYKGIKLEADSIVFFRQSREVYAEGNIRLRIGESELAAQHAYVDIDHDVGYLVEAHVRVSAAPGVLKQFGKTEKEESKLAERGPLPEPKETRPTPAEPSFLRTRDPYGIYLDPIDDPQARTNLLFRADKLVMHSRLLYTAENAFITTDDMVHPLYGVQAKEMEFTMRELPDPLRPGKTDLKPHKVVARKARLKILGVGLIPIPKISYDLVRKNPYFSADFGNSKRWGPFLLTRVGYNLQGSEDKVFDPTRIYVDLDERYRRGPAVGAEMDWQTGRRPSEDEGNKDIVRFDRGAGHIRFYVIDELQTDRDDDVRRARRDLERRIQPKIDGFPRRQFDANLLFAQRRRLQDAGPASFDIDEHRDEFRGYADFQHHQPLKRFAGIDNLQLDFKYQRNSDRDFMLEYFQNNYLSKDQPEALVSVRKPGDNYSMELLYRANPQDFDAAPPRSAVDFGTFTGYEPALTYSLVPTPLYYGFFINGEVQAARMTRHFDRAIYDQSGFDSGRVYAKIDITRPFKWGALNFVPHLGTQQQGYDNSRNGESVFQGALTYGMDVTSRIYGTFTDFENDALALQGLRHIIEPRISYRGVSEPREDPTDLLDFDEIDDLQNMDRVTFALDQVFQTRVAVKGEPGATQTRNFAGLELAVDAYPRSRDQDRLLRGDALDLFRAEGFFRVLDVARFDAAIGMSIEDGEVERAVYGVTIDPHTRWRLRLEERYNFKDRDNAIVGSDQFRVKLEYQVSERWGVGVENISERQRSVLHHKGRQIQRLSLTRHYGSLDATLTYAVDRNVNDSSLFLSVRPVATYRNLIVPSQDLLVGAGEVSPDEEAPEEQNYNPLELLKRRKNTGGPPPKKNSRDAPPLIRPRDTDVPLPRQPPSTPPADKRVEADPDADLFREPQPQDAGVFRDPNRASRPAPARPRKVDDDDWITPPPTPATAR